VCACARQALRKAGLGDANLAQLAAWNMQLQAAFERMANIKEYRCALHPPASCQLPECLMPAAVAGPAHQPVAGQEPDARGACCGRPLLCEATEGCLTRATSSV
jgi:hypothetical protein